MMSFRLLRILGLAIVAGAATGAVFSQESDRTGLAVELPELNTGRISAVKTLVPTAQVSLIKFWVLNPAGDNTDWNRIRLKINAASANTACSQSPAATGKVFNCDLGRFPRFRLHPYENDLEIDADTRDGRHLYASFKLVTDARAAQTNAKSGVGSPSVLGFSGRKFAVIMGVSQYRYNDVGLGNLAYADADADALYKWLTTSGGFRQGDVLYLTNGQATISSVRYSLTRFLTKAAETDLILFYFAGHGTPDPFDTRNLYYLVNDSKVADLKDTALPMTELKQIIDKNLRSKRAIFLLDTCHSAGISGKAVVGFSRPSGGSRGVDAEVYDERQLKQVQVKNEVSSTAGRLFSSSGRAIFTSSDVGEASREGKEWGGGHGVFTWALLEGLSGKADANRDKVVTTDELFGFVQQTVRSETGSKQNPRLFSNLTGGIELASVR